MTETDTKTNYEPLQIAALDTKDLEILASCLQDALVPITSMNFEEEKGQFYLVLNRFCWECQPESIEGKEVHKRVHCGVHVDHVKKVKNKGFDPNHKDGFMNLLTIHNKKAGCLNLVFSGGGEVELEVDKLKCLVKDLGEPYPTHNKPHHPIAD